MKICYFLHFICSYSIIKQNDYWGDTVIDVLLLAALDDPRREEEFLKFYNKYIQLSYNIAFKYLKNDIAAKTVLQDAFYNIAQKFSTVIGLDEAKQEVYIYITVKNKCIDILRQDSRSDIPIGDMSDLESEAPSIEERLIVKEEERLLLNCLKKLPIALRTALSYRYLYEMSISSISVLTDTPIATVKSNLQRGKKLLKKAMKGASK